MTDWTKPESYRPSVQMLERIVMRDLLDPSPQWSPLALEALRRLSRESGNG